MKLTILLTLLLFSVFAEARSIQITSRSSLADTVVYITSRSSLADKVVYTSKSSVVADDIVCVSGSVPDEDVVAAYAAIQR